MWCGQSPAAQVERESVTVGDVHHGFIPALDVEDVEASSEQSGAVLGVEAQWSAPVGKDGRQFRVVATADGAHGEQPARAQDPACFPQRQPGVGQVVERVQGGRPAERAVGEGQVRSVRADCRAGCAGDVAGPVDDHGADGVAGQKPGQGAVPAADIDDGAAASGGKPAGDEGMDVTSCTEPLGGGLIGGETTGIDVVVALRSSPADGSASSWTRRVCTSSTLTPASRLPGNPGLYLPQGADRHRTHPRSEGKRLSAGIENDPGDEIVADPVG
jgi:hypothetical protein